MAIDAIGGGNVADVLGMLSEGTAQAASMSVLKIAIDDAASTGAALAQEISSAGQLNVYA